MAKSPSFDSQIEKAAAQVQRVETLTAALVAGLDQVPARPAPAAFESETREMAELKSVNASLEAELLLIVSGLAARTNQAYTDFDRVDEVGRFNAFFSLFRRKNTGAFKTVRARTLAIADRLRSILVEAARMHVLSLTEKDRLTALVLGAEPKLVTSMEKRRVVVTKMDEARQRDKELALALATVRRKIADQTDEERLAQLQADETEAAQKYDSVLETRRQLNEDHGILDRQAILLGDVIDVLNDQIALHTLVTNALSIEAERCLQLYDAAYGTLEPLSALAQAAANTTDAASKPAPLVAFAELLRLHEQGGVTMQDIEKRKARVEESLQRRRSGNVAPEA